MSDKTKMRKIHTIQDHGIWETDQSKAGTSNQMPSPLEGPTVIQAAMTIEKLYKLSQTYQKTVWNQSEPLTKDLNKDDYITVTDEDTIVHQIFRVTNRRFDFGKAYVIEAAPVEPMHGEDVLIIVHRRWTWIEKIQYHWNHHWKTGKENA
jgi:hypothetical protein